MPQMGESIAEGTITTWLKKVGDNVKRDEPLFEISTDKVDAEIPSPVEGVLTEIKAQAGETVAVNSVVAVIGEVGEAKSAPAKAAPKADAKAEAPKAEAKAAPAKTPAKTAEPAEVVDEAAVTRAAPAPRAETRPPKSGSTAEADEEERRRTKSSPLVRKIAAENEVDITQVSGSGIGGRVTKDDIMGHLSKGAAPHSALQPAPAQPAQASPAARTGAGQSQLLPSSGAPATGGGGNIYDVKQSIPDAYRARVFEGDRVEQLTTMRSKIAEHMVLSRRISAHVNTVWDIDFTRVAQLRTKYKGAWEERHGVNLTYTSFIMKAAVDAVKGFPIVNASLDGNNVIYHRNINLGLAVSLDWGLIVPVIHGADELNLLGLARRGSDLASRARSRKLMPDEIAGGTFTITNPGQIGPFINLPIINQPQVAIMGVGSIEKRPVVINDAIAIRTRGNLSLTFDHRVIDGAVADNFMARMKKNIEEFDENAL
ncbi:MAG: 2-oxo acid dehydrogenase subunit E2 [Clostridia bacterium]|nr:2-oxo acid dehydrogenase subunit E2 [Deltaproteobacteria bacterium]